MKIIKVKINLYVNLKDYDCVLEKDNKCVKKRIETPIYCNVYTGSNEEICNSFVPSDPSIKVCTIISSSCQEQ